MKTLLCHVEQGEQFGNYIETVLAVAQKYNSHVIASHITPSLNIYMPFTHDYMVPGEVTNSIVKEWVEIANETRAAFTRHWPAAGSPWEWIQTTGNTAATLIEQASTADLTIVNIGTRALSDGSQSWPLASDITLSNGLPILALPANCRTPLGSKPVIIAWDGSLEATHAIRHALPMLKSASNIIVAEIEKYDDEKEEELPAADIAPFLARHGLNVEGLSRVPVASIAEELLDIAHENDAELIVMGAYGHMRLREFFFGGVTRALLQSSDIPLFLCH